MTRFADALADGKGFVVTCELIPGRGHAGKSIDSILQFVQGIRSVPEVKALSITDNAGGNPALSADVLGAELIAGGTDIIVHFSCKDMNRNFVESRAYSLQRSGITSLLVVTGDYPVFGYLGLPKPVFDIDAVNAIHYLACMNAGLSVAVGSRTVQLEKTRFCIGAAVSPFKWTEGPSAMQYMKLDKKLQAGADYVITQLGYDARKHIECLAYLREKAVRRVPVLASVYVLTAGAADLMHRGEIPGCYVSDELLAQVREEAKAEDKGKRTRLERAARQMALLRGLGYNGAHIEGMALRAEDIAFIVGRSHELQTRWEGLLPEFSFAPPNPFYFFDGGERALAPSAGERVVERRTPRIRIASPLFWATRLLHRMFFVRDTPGYRLMRAASRFLDAHRRAYEVAGVLERSVKRPLFDCRHCDDCTLFETYYLCPEARCPKGMRIGPCGGSRANERCEVFEDRWCIWRNIYWRAKNRGELEKLRYLIRPRDWSLYKTNSWVNYFLHRDHSGHPLESCRESAAATAPTSALSAPPPPPPSKA
jgi:methylenetetrahydrofolate reductase (NADPH)